LPNLSLFPKPLEVKNLTNSIALQNQGKTGLFRLTYQPHSSSADCARAVVLKLFLIAYHLCVPYCHHVPPCSRKSQCAKYQSIKSLEMSSMSWCHSFGSSCFTSLTSIIMTVPLKNFCTYHAVGASQKYFRSGPALAKASPVHVCISAIKLCHEFAFNLSSISHQINYLTISSYYPVHRLLKLQIT